ncbi:unnamed protein product [Paramecium sonneborni]|uniref:Uncharacterized protein n=1 Tax=Paramecium sonneborni TaxID=65129 RepID=A0A8S1KBX8_9CILI|nr:unnamed protein product [Paramecium sonneborni]
MENNVLSAKHTIFLYNLLYYLPKYMNLENRSQNQFQGRIYEKFAEETKYLVDQWRNEIDLSKNTKINGMYF